MTRYCITDNLDTVRGAVKQGVELIQIRAKELSTRDLSALVGAAMVIAGDRVVVNTRADVAISQGAAGVHLPGDSIAPRLIRRIAPTPFVIGVSCHSMMDLRRAEKEGADFAVYGPVFATGEKSAIGIKAFAQGAASVRMPVYALGGITWDNAAVCMEVGAAGIAGISLFQSLR